MKIEKLNEKVDWKVAMEGNNSNIDRLRNVATQVNIDPVMGEVVRENEKSDKMTGDTFKKLSKELDGITPKDPGTGKKVTIKPYTEKLNLDESLFKESWTSFDGSWREQTVKRVNYEEEDISDIAYELMNWYGEYFEGWEAADIKDVLYGLEGERIPGSSCPIVFTMEESEDDELDWDSEDYDESLNTKLKEDNYDRPGYENMYLVSWEDSIGDYHESKVKADYPQHAIDKIKKSKHIYKVINVEEINMFTAPKRIRKAELIEKKKEKSKHLCEDYGVREYSDMLYDMIENGEVDAKNIAEDLIYWCSEDDIEKYMKVNELIFEDDEIEESKEKKSLVDEVNESWKDESWREDGEKHTLLKYYVDDKDKFHGAIMKDPTSSEFGSIIGYIYEGDKIVKKDESFNSINDAKKWVEKEVQDLLDKKDESLKEDWALEPGKTFRSKSNNEITIKEVIPYVSEYDGTPSLRIKYDYVLNNGKFGSSECSAKDLFNMLNESINLLEYASEDEEDDEYTVYDLLNDRLFGYGINKSNFRQRWKFAEVEPTVKTSSGKLKRGYFYPTIHADELVTGKPDDRRAFVDGGVGVFVHDDEEATLAKKCAEELKLDFNMKKLVKPMNGFNYIAVIRVPDEIQEMTVKDYVESIGKSMNDFLRGKGEKPKADFSDSTNYSSRKTNKESEE